MADFSASAAIGSGFRLIARNPLAVLWWAAAYLAIGVLPQVLVLGAAVPDLIPLYQQTARDALQGVAPSAQSGPMLALQAKMMALQPILVVTSLVSRTVLLGAVFRGVLTPEDRRFGYLRLSRQELWLGLALAVLWVMMVLLIFALMVPCMIVVGVMAVRGDHAASAWDGLSLAGVALVALAAIVWVLIRLSLALPMSFASSRFLFFESWTLTRGHALKIFGVGLATVLMVIVVEVVLAGAAVGAGVLHARGLAALVQQPPDALVRTVMMWLPLVAVVGSLLGAVLMAILTAPSADIYRQLTGGARAP